MNYNYGNPVIVEQKDLQNKQKRYYFQDTIRLNRDEIFISPFFFVCSLFFARFFINKSRFKKIKEHERLQEEKFRGVLEMAGAVCHEMNQPLMVISGYTALLIEDLPEQSPHYKEVMEIRSQTDRLARITRKLMTITRYETRDYLNSKIIDIHKASDDK